MHFLVQFFTLLGAVVVVKAHFQLAFPSPRGVFNENNEPNLCDGYTTPAPNRTQFPLSGGIYTLNSEHPSWTIGAFLSTSPNPTSFDDFKLINTFSQVNGEGQFCLPLDLKSSNFTGLQSGQNVTLQIVFQGGDGQLYQCADVTLSDTASVSGVPCNNATSNNNKSFAIASYSTPLPVVMGVILAALSMALFV